MQRKFLKIRLQKGSNILQAAGNCRWKGQVSPCVAMECTFQGIGKNVVYLRCKALLVKRQNLNLLFKI